MINNVKVRTGAKTKLIERLEDKRREKIKHKDKKQEDILLAILCMNDDTIYNHKEYIKLIVYNIFNNK